MTYARILLMSTTALVGPTMCPGSEPLGVPLMSSRIVRAALRGVNPPGVMRLTAPSQRPLRPCRRRGGWSIRLIMGQQGPDHSGIVVGSGHRGHMGTVAVCERAQPPSLRIGPSLGTLHDGARPMNRPRPHRPTPAFRNPAYPFLAPTGILSRHQAQPGRQMASIAKRLGRPTVATSAVAVNGPIPGTAAGFWQTGCVRYTRAIRCYLDTCVELRQLLRQLGEGVSGTCGQSRRRVIQKTNDGGPDLLRG